MGSGRTAPFPLQAGKKLDEFAKARFEAELPTRPVDSRCRSLKARGFRRQEPFLPPLVRLDSRRDAQHSRPGVQFDVQPDVHPSILTTVPCHHGRAGPPVDRRPQDPTPLRHFSTHHPDW